jgi:hypothetical protein
MKRVLARIAFLAFLLLPALARAQGNTATLSGRLTDQSGDVLVGAKVSATNEEAGVGVATLTNADGVYVIPNLRPGPYHVNVEMLGFRPIVLTGLVLHVQDSVGRNFTMQRGEASQSITVTAGLEEFSLSSAVSTVMNPQFVENMPLNGRSLQSLMQLVPGVVVTPAAQNMQGQFSVDGQRTNTNYFTIDGVSANFGSTASVILAQSIGGSLPALTIGGGTNSIISIDAVQEFRIQTSGYAPEYGRSPGAQISIVTKSGSNRFHGNAYDYLRNDVFDARSYFDQPPLPKPPLRQNDFGGTLGGPILKDRTFFFLAYEGLRLWQPQTASGYFYTQDARAAVAPVYQPFVNALPVPNGALLDPTCNDLSKPCLAQLNVAYSDSSNFDAYSLRMDHYLKQRVMLFARYGHTPSIQGQRNFSYVENDSLNNDMATAGATVTLSPTKVNDFRVNWAQSSGKAVLNPDGFYGAVPPADSVTYRPGDTFNHDEDLILFPNAGQEFDIGTRVANVQRQLNFVDTLSLVAGTHQVKAGVDFRRLEPSSQGGDGYELVLTNFGSDDHETRQLVILHAGHLEGNASPDFDVRFALGNQHAASLNH